MTKTMTRATALTNAIALFAEDAPEREVLTKMLASITKPRTTSGKPSKAAERNARLAAEVLRVMPEDASVDGAWIGAHVDGFNINAEGRVSAQHVTAVMRLLVDAGRVTKSKIGKRVAYTLA